MKKRIAIVAHDMRKMSVLSWVGKHKEVLEKHHLYATGTTGQLIEKELGISIIKLNSGPLGGDQQIGAKIAVGEIDCLIFFIDPLSAHPHESDIRALQRIAILKNIPTAFNESTGDLLVSSPFLNSNCVDCEKLVPLRKKAVNG